MLFLAVFCGYLAEYQLEHKIEHNREKQYIRSLIEDAQTDIKNLSAVIAQFKVQLKHLDTLLSKIPAIVNGYDSVFYGKIYWTAGYPDFVKADRTMQQLKNSGNMRLIRKEKAADIITEYDLMNRDLEIDIASLERLFYELRTARFETINTADLEIDLVGKSLSQLATSGKNYLLTTDTEKLGKLKNMTQYFQERIKFVINEDETLLAKAMEMVTVLKESYGLN